MRIIPAPGKTVGDRVEMGGLLGSAPVMPVHDKSSEDFIAAAAEFPRRCKASRTDSWSGEITCSTKQKEILAFSRTIYRKG